jgi:hypothetical protein
VFLHDLHDLGYRHAFHELDDPAHPCALESLDWFAGRDGSGRRCDVEEGFDEPASGVLPSQPPNTVKKGSEGWSVDAPRVDTVGSRVEGGVR